MSSTFSQESAASASDLSGLGCEPSHSANASHSVSRSSPGTGRQSPATTISEPLRQNDLFPMEFPLMRSAADSPARMSASPELAMALMENAAASGPITLGFLASLESAEKSNSLSWRTSQHSLEGGLIEFLETWPRSGLMQNGTAYRLPTLVSDNFGTEFGLWPTPNATAFKGGRSSPRRGVANPERNNWQDWCSLVLGQRYPVPETAEQVMGFPTGHTEIKPSGTPSSLSSLKSSGERSCDRRMNGETEWICDRCKALWYGELAKTDWRPAECRSPEISSHQSNTEAR
jgi:hypothetical protein